MEDRGEGLYATDLGGVLNIFGREGLYKIVRYCHENGLKPKYEAIQNTYWWNGDL